MRNRLRALGAPLFSVLVLSACASAVDPADPAAASADGLTIIPVSGPPTGGIGVQLPTTGPYAGSGEYVLKGLASKCLDIGSAAVGSPVRLNDCNGSAAQQIQIQETTILAIDSVMLRVGNLCLTPQGGGTSAGTAVVLAYCDGTKVQQWTPENASSTSLSNGTRFQSKGNADLALAVRGSGTANGTPMEINSAIGTMSDSGTWAPTQLEIAGSSPMTPTASEAVVRNSAGRATAETLAYVDHANTETGFEFWMESWNAQSTDPRPWTQLGSAGAQGGTGRGASTPLTLEANRIYSIAARSVNANAPSRASYVLIRTSPPNPAVSPQVIVKSSTSLQVMWTQPSDATRVDGYLVQGGPQPADIRQAGSTGLQHATTFNGLTPGTKYCFTVASYNDLWGQASPVQVCGTTSGTAPPPQAPDLFGKNGFTSPVFPTTADTITFGWTECNLGTATAAAHQYVVMVEPEAGGTWSLPPGNAAALAPGQCVAVSTPISPLPAGRYVLQTWVDSSNVVMESNESNNGQATVVIDVE